MHLSKWNADDGDTEYEAVEDVGEPYPDAANEEPQHIHEDAQTAWLRWLPFHFRAQYPCIRGWCDLQFVGLLRVS